MEFYFVFLFFAIPVQVLSASPPVEVIPETAILLENSTLQVKCRVGVPITYCRFSVPGIPNGLSLRPDLPPHEGIQYLGAGFEMGECGMQIRHVSPKHSGVIQCSMAFAKVPTESQGNFVLTVAKPPEPPLLQVHPGIHKGIFREGETIQATCRISNARPIANISWFLGSEPIYDRLGPTVAEEENGLMTISQNLTRKVTYEDNGKDLKCVAGHIALLPDKISHSIYKLNVEFPPKPKSQELEKFGFTIGQPGKIIVTFQANPIPQIIWKVDEDTLKENTRDRTGRFEAGVLQHKGAGTWDAVLYINSVRPEEVEKRYTLIARNELGYESYKVAISTSPEPPADITTGAIVGIVIAILIILLLVFMLIFARATGRWCFAGGVPRPVGESRFPLRWSLRRERNSNPAKVKSLIYKNYSLMENEDGSKMYVSPDEKALKIAQSRVSLENERIQKINGDRDSDVETEYEVPVKLKEEPGQKDLNGEVVPRARQSYNPFLDIESLGDSDDIHLPPNIVSVEGGPVNQKRKKSKNKKSKKENEITNESIEETGLKRESHDGNPLKFEKSIDDMPATSRLHEKTQNEGKKTFTVKNGFWKKDKKKEEESTANIETKVKELILETDLDEPKPTKKRFSLPWAKEKEKTSSTEYFSESEERESKSSKKFSDKIRTFSWNKKKKTEKVDLEKDVESDAIDRKVTYASNLIDLLGENDNLDLEEPKEIHLNSISNGTVVPTEGNDKRLSKEEDTPKEQKRFRSGIFRRRSSDEPKCKKRRSSDKNHTEPSPLQKMLGIRKLKKQVSNDNESEKEESQDKEEEEEGEEEEGEEEEGEEEEGEEEEEEEGESEEEGELYRRRDLAGPVRESFDFGSRETVDFSENGDTKENTSEQPELSSDVQTNLNEGCKENEVRKPLQTKFKYTITFPQEDDDLLKLRKRKSRENIKIDPNPLRKMFRTKGIKRLEEQPGNEYNVRKRVENELNMGRSEEFGSKNPFRYDPKESEADSNLVYRRLTYLDGDLTLAGESRPSCEDVRDLTPSSDTESADHGSTDKSSMSKLTSEKQPKKFMSRLFGSVKKSKLKEHVPIDNDVEKAAQNSFEVVVKEAPEEVKVESGVTKPEGIVYAELDMARGGPGNVLRRDDEKTEYAEIIYPNNMGKPPSEQVAEELRKSRENLVSSRENLTEIDSDVYTTPDGKKEAAV